MKYKLAEPLQAIILIFICSSSIISCATKKTNKREEKDISNIYKLWVDDYRYVAFRRCVYLGLNRQADVKSVFQRDHSTSQDFPYGLEGYKKIDSLVQPIIQSAKADSIKHYQKYLKGRNEIEIADLDGLPIFKYCLDYFESEQLKKIANSEISKRKHLWSNNLGPIH